MEVAFISAVALLAVGVLAKGNCCYSATALATVLYYTCTELANNYGISLEKFFLLNPLMGPDCKSIETER
jgi:hypothetical protein